MAGSVLWRCCFSVLVVACELSATHANILESIYWNTTNTKFVPGQGLILYPQIGDKMDIVCPRVDADGSMEGVEYYKLYMVPREQLDTCTVTKADIPLLNCAKPDQNVKFILKFQELSQQLWGLEFIKGKDYHIISTSNGTIEGLDNQEGGVCKTKSMKIILKVGQIPSDPPPKDYPTRHPPKHTDTGNNTNEVLDKQEVFPHEGEAGEGGGGGKSTTMTGSEVALFASIGSASVIVIIIIILVVLLLKYRRRHRQLVL